MVWRRSSWAVHYQNLLPASDTLFTEAQGPSPQGESNLRGPLSPPPPCGAWPAAGILLDLTLPDPRIQSTARSEKPAQSCPRPPGMVWAGPPWARGCLQHSVQRAGQERRAPAPSRPHSSPCSLQVGSQRDSAEAVSDPDLVIVNQQGEAESLANSLACQ